jgi:aspartate/methionine/tyrosine aminotransferase
VPPGGVKLPGVLPDIAYLDFAVRWFGKVQHDLATSGLRPISAQELGSVNFDDLGARERFTAAVALRYAVPQAEVVPCLGTSGALFVAYASLLDRGDTLLVEEPAYEPLWRVAEALGLSITRFERKLGRLDPELVLRALTPGVRLVAVTNPHNPTAVLVEDRTLAELGSRLAERGVPLLVDEAYLESVAPGRTARRLGPNIAACSSVTKCLGVPWARAGWLILPELQAAPAHKAERHTMGTAPPGCWAWGSLALDQAGRLLERARSIQAAKRELVDAFAAKHARSFEWSSPPPGSLFGWLSDRRGRKLRGRIERGVESKGVLVSPGDFFGDPCGFRISWTTDAQALERGLELLEEVLEP